MSSLIKRTRQFMRAVFSKIKPSDLDIVQQYLNLPEQDLFTEMGRAVQKHSINTAITILKMPVEQTGTNRTALVKAALLHDMAKTRDSINLFDRVCYVLGQKLSSRLILRLAAPGNGLPLSRFRNALYIHLNHPELGAKLAEKAGLDETLIYLLRYHHDRSKAADSVELAALIKADETN